MKKISLGILAILVLTSPISADVTYTEEEKDDAQKVLALGIGLVAYAAIIQSQDGAKEFDINKYKNGIVLYENHIQKLTLFPSATKNYEMMNHESAFLKSSQPINYSQGLSVDILRFDIKLFN